MKKFKVGLLTMSDGRPYLHNLQFDMNMGYQAQIKERLEATGLVEVVCGDQPINTNIVAKEQAQKLKDAGVELTIFNYAIWCYPHLTAVATNFAPGPYLLFCNIHPSECGMVGMMAASGTLDQLNLPHKRVFGSILEDEVLGKVMSFIRAGCAVNRLRGLTYGNFGGRPMGMYTTVANQAQWQKVAGGAGWQYRLQRFQLHPRQAGGSDPFLLRSAPDHRGAGSGLHRHQGSRRPDRLVRHHGPGRGLPERSL